MLSAQPLSLIKLENQWQSDLTIHVFWAVTLGKQVTDSQVFKEMYFLQLQRVTRCRNYE
jgi:hypothetical protein